MLAVIALAEQTALNSISPYLPDMTSRFPEVQEGQVGLYVGLIASSFALAQFATNFFWGWLSDRIGRKPIILLGTALTAACFVAFGFCRTLWQAVLVQALMGLVNGNQGVVSTCLGEITDKSNQSEAFTYLPVVYGIGGITGPVIGGLLVMEHLPFHKEPYPYPYLPPNLFSASILVIDLIISMLWLEESLEEARNLPPLGERISSIFAWLWQFSSAPRPTYTRRASRRRRRRSSGSQTLTDGSTGAEGSQGSQRDDAPPTLFPDVTGETLTKKEIFNRNTILLLLTFLIFQLANISYNSLYPIFAEASPPIGRNLTPEEIGLSLGFAGVVTIIFQVGFYGKLREKIGNKVTYRVSLAAFVIAFILTPFVGYKHEDGVGMGKGKEWLWVQLGFVLIVKTVAAVGGLTSALLLVRRSFLWWKPFHTNSLVCTDHKHGSHASRSGNTQRSGSDPVRRRTCHRTLHLGRALLGVDPRQAQGRGGGIWSVWGSGLCGILTELRDPGGRAGGRGLGRGVSGERAHERRGGRG